MKISVILICAAMAVFISSCKKDTIETVRQPLKLIELEDIEVPNGQTFRLDLDSNAKVDFIFGQEEFFSVIEQAYVQDFHITTLRNTFVYSPLTDYLPASEKGLLLTKNNTASQQWCNGSQMNMSRKTTYADNGRVEWEGTWLNQFHKYIPIKLMDNNNRSFLGWIEVSMNQDTETITLHRAALSTVDGADAVLGEL